MEVLTFIALGLAGLSLIIAAFAIRVKKIQYQEDSGRMGLLEAADSSLNDRVSNLESLNQTVLSLQDSVKTVLASEKKRLETDNTILDKVESIGSTVESIDKKYGRELKAATDQIYELRNQLNEVAASTAKDTAKQTPPKRTTRRKTPTKPKAKD